MLTDSALPLDLSALILKSFPGNIYKINPLGVGVTRFKSNRLSNTFIRELSNLRLWRDDNKKNTKDNTVVGHATSF